MTAEMVYVSVAFWGFWFRHSQARILAPQPAPPLQVFRHRRKAFVIFVSWSTVVRVLVDGRSIPTVADSVLSFPDRAF
jgi:hypothetical protein